MGQRLLEIGALLLVLVPGFAGVGHVIAGFLAIMVGKDEETWMRRGEVVFGMIGLWAWIGGAVGILLVR